MNLRPEDLDPAALLRCGADDELCKEGAARLREHLADHPEDATRLEFDKELCCAVGRVMCQCETPAGLRERIEAGMTEDDGLGAALARRGTETRSKSFWVRPFGSIISVAAMLALALVVVQIVTSVVGGSGTRLHASEIREFVGGQHSSCVLGSNLAKFTVNEVEQVPAQFQALTNRSLALSELLTGASLGLRFVEAGECAVPPHNKAKSLHLRFVSDGTYCEEGTSISVFVQPYTGYVEMEEGHTYRFDSEGRGERTVYGWVRDRLVYYVVADTDAPCELFRRAAGMPEAEALPGPSK